MIKFKEASSKIAGSSDSCLGPISHNRTKEMMETLFNASLDSEFAPSSAHLKGTSSHSNVMYFVCDDWCIHYGRKMADMEKKLNTLTKIVK